MAAYHIRCATECDLEACTAIATDAFHIYTAERRREHLRQLIPHKNVLLAEEGAVVLGYASFLTNWFNSTFLKLVVVDAAARRRGVAGTLIETIAREHCSSGRFFSSTEADNLPSIAMHEKLGFKPSGFLDNLPQPERELFYFRKVH